MRKSMKKLFTVMLVLVLACKLFAAEGVVTYVKGKVEVKRGANWVTLKVGDKVNESEVINTGFQSEAKVKLMNNILYLGPVTRVTLSTLSSTADRDKVNIYLSTGSLRSNVNRTDTKRVSYTVRTPIAVASVRGTKLFFYGPGSMGVEEGIVAVTNVERLAQPRKESKKAKDQEKQDKGADVSNNEEKSRDEIIEENLENMMNTEGMPGGAIYLTNNMGISIGETVDLAPSNDAETKIADIGSKVSSSATKEAEKSDAPPISAPVVQEEVVVPTTGSLSVTVTIPVSAE